MSVFLFLIILVSLIVVHELGHFAFAKLFGIRVDEFGIGFPPRIFGKKFGETIYSINWLPFGGFVKIFGEDGQNAEAATEAQDLSRSFVAKPRYIQAAVLVAGVFMNIVTAWVILSAGYMIGLPADAESVPYGELKEVTPTIVEVSENSPAKGAGVDVGEKVVRIESASGDSIEAASGSDALRAFIAGHGSEELTLTLLKGDIEREIKATPTDSVAGAEGKRALGIALIDVGIMQLPVHTALFAGAVLTKDLTEATAVGLYDFVKSIFMGEADFASVSGPVGIVGIVGDASQLGLTAVLMLAAVISINLAIINLIPFPALDGGRLFIVIIEAIRRKPIPQNLFLWLNAGGFALLILLMLVVTYNDIVKLFV